MKKSVVLVIATIALGALTGRTQDLTIVKNVIPVTISGTLSDKTKVTNADLLPGGTLTGQVVYASLQIISLLDTNEIAVIGTSAISGTITNIGEGTNTVIIANEDAILLRQISRVDVEGGKFVAALKDVGNDEDIDGAVWIMNGTVKADSKGTNISAKVTGIWKDDDAAIQSLNIKSAK